jgi:hypothetical protein
MGWIITVVLGLTTVMYGVAYHKQVKLTVQERLRQHQ